jgi:molybdopterin-guanine dinucleotide biosynthesis protein A
MNNPDVTGIVLAGGKSSRMGSDKSLLIWNGITLVERAIELLRPLCSQVIISSNNYVYDFTGCETWPDELPHQAPIIGIYSCLKRSITEVNIMLSCDMPCVSADMLEHLLGCSGKGDVVVPIHNGFMEPLCGIYKRSVLSQLEKQIDIYEFSLHRFIESCPHHYAEINEKFPFYNNRLFLNINTPDELRQLLDLSE